MSLQDRCFNPTSFTMAQHPSIRSRKHAPGVHPLLGTSLVALSALATASAAHAQATATQEEGKTLEAVSVKASRVTSFKVEESASNKFTQPLVDTPKTVQIVNQQMLKEQGAGTLMDALRNTPGITMQLGEGGNTSAGDTFQMRGFSAQTSVFVDGVRDLGVVSRDVFNIEQVEVVKGAAGSDIGRGAAAGYINLITKLPSRDELSEASLTLGTADKKRITADINRAFGDSGAFRINVMTQDSGVDGRDFVLNKSTAVAPALAFGLGTPTRVYLYSLHTRAKNRPDGGVPTVGLSGYRRATNDATSNTLNASQVAALNGASAVDSSNYYGSVNDYEDVDSDMATAKVEHDLGNKTTVRNLTRIARSHSTRVMTGITALNSTNVSNAAAPSTWTVSRNRQGTDQVNDILINQTSLNTSFSLAGMQHDLVTGLELSYERQSAKSFSTTGLTVPAANLYNPNPHVSLPQPYLSGEVNEGKSYTTAVYVLDTVTLSPEWKVNGGLRLDRYNTWSHTYTGSAQASLSKSDTLTSWNLAAIYKPAENGSVYLAYATSLTPPGSSNFSLSSSSSSASNTALDPQETENYELGTKWDLLDKRLNVSAAIYRTDNDKQISYDSLSKQYFQTGKQRVQGIELSAVGLLTNFWKLTAGITTMHAKQMGQSSFSTNNNSTSTTDGVRWSPTLAATLWTSYDVNDWTFGAGASYYSSQKRTVSTSTNASTNAAGLNMAEIPGYTVCSAMVSYKASKNVNLQLNVTNLFDKEYIATLNNNGARYTPGAPRAASLTASVKF